jgi:hypothetical protein
MACSRVKFTSPNMVLGTSECMWLPVSREHSDSYYGESRFKSQLEETAVITEFAFPSPRHVSYTAVNNAKNQELIGHLTLMKSTRAKRKSHGQLQEKAVSQTCKLAVLCVSDIGQYVETSHVTQWPRKFCISLHSNGSIQRSKGVVTLACLENMPQSVK